MQKNVPLNGNRTRTIMEMVHYEVQDRIGYIRLNRPEKRNALSFDMVTAIKDALRKAEHDESCKVIVIHAAGEVFCSGADLASLQKLQTNTIEENMQDSLHLSELFRMIYTSGKCIIAQVEGPALAGGCGLATVCDYAFATPASKFGYTEVKIGFVPAIVMIFLLRKLGESKARPLLLSGDIISAEQAKHDGLIYDVVDATEIAQTVTNFAKRIATTCSGQSIALTKRMINQVQHLNFDDALDYAAEMNAHARKSDDCQRGIQAFLQKEKISW